jgi:uncharacterized protein YjbI with pentapeptide repeats
MGPRIEFRTPFEPAETLPGFINQLRAHPAALSHIEGINFSGHDLTGVDFTGATIISCDFEQCDLSQACFESASLQTVSFRGAVLVGCDFRLTRMLGCKLKDSELEDSTFRDAILFGCSFRRSSMSSVDLLNCYMSHTDLSDASLRGAEMVFTNACEVIFGGTDFSGARFYGTVLAQCYNLDEAHGLAEIEHLGSSTMDVNTFKASAGELPDAFLLGIGLTGDEIQNLRAMYSVGIRFYSCFLSHADPDQEFADHLRKDLIANSVSCWHYRHDIQGGKHWRTQVQTAIKLHDKVVLICSENSVVRQNVVDEIITAIERERETGEQKLFPIRLDDFILDLDILDIADAAMESGRWREDWVRYVRSYHIPDFSGWKDHDSYQREFQKLIRDLKNPKPR